MRTTLSLAVIALFVFGTLAAAGPAEAQRRGRSDDSPPGVEVTVAPSPSADSPFRYIFTIRPTAWSSAEVVADRRLLTFVVHPEGRGRRRVCRHPNAPRRAPEGRVVTLSQSGETTEHREWFDLRMYCWGRALRALRAGARVEVYYGFRRRGRRRWVAREAGADRRSAVRRLEVGELSFAAIDGDEDSEGAESADGEEEPAIVVSMRPSDVRTGGGLVFRPRIRATRRALVYVRDDLFRYRIDGPLGETECALPRTRISPVIDFYRRLGGRRRARGTLAIHLACRDAFQVAGIYEVTPIVDLIYDADRWEIDDVVTGTFEGEPVPIRVRRGERGYVEQVPGTDIGAEDDDGGDS